MVEFKNILFPVDFSAENRKVAPWVKMMVDRHEASLHLLNVVRDINAYVGFYVPHVSLDVVAQEMAEQAKRKLDESAREHFDGLEVTTEAIIGNAAKLIADYAVEHDIDLIIMGSHGRTALDHIVLGGVTDKVVKHAKVPVMTVNTRHR